MATAEDLMAWLHEPLVDLRQGLSDQPDLTWPQRRTQFLTDLGIDDAYRHPVTDDLLDQLDAMPDEKRDDVLNSDELQALATAVIDQVCASQPPDEYDAGEPYDESAWLALLTEVLADWDGYASSWPAFAADTLLPRAKQVGLDGPTEQLVRFVADMSNEDRIATFEAYGVTIVQTPPANWYPFLAQTLAEWDGYASSWPAFAADTLLAWARQVGLDGPTEQLVRFVADMSNEDRIATFEAYGATIGSVNTEPVLPSSQEEVVIDAAAEEVLARVLDKYPDLATLSEEDQRDVLLDVLRERVARQGDSRPGDHLRNGEQS
ncbi:hypothetical protein AB0M36_16750 [Actinoplanes sp. NPDC051346]|uniref:hypothetical protein n=1 Tax=Actinoplanes sp. NPDC051346 TaxID=3155048 RepID=UPI003433808A